MQRRDFLSLTISATALYFSKVFNIGFVKMLKPEEIQTDVRLSGPSVFKLPENPADGLTLAITIDHVDLSHPAWITCIPTQSIECRTCDLEIDVTGSYLFTYSSDYKFWAVERVLTEHQILG